MRDAILEKLGNHLTSVASREADVVYLLVEIGKYLEARPGEGPFAEAATYPLLRFYRNWAVHAYIRDTKPADPLSAELERACRAWLERGDLAAARAIVGAVITPERLRIELGEFLRAHTLEVGLVESAARWADFLHSLVGVLSDVPLVFAGFVHLEVFLVSQGDRTIRWRIRAGGQLLEDLVR